MSLPNELWRQIFRHAVHVPQLFYASWDQDPDIAIWEGWKKAERFPNGFEMETKLAIVQVCRAWRELGLEFLYEAIRIPNLWSGKGHECVSLLVDVFDGSISRGGEPADGPPSTKYGYGWWTKRIDCPLDLFSSESSVVGHLYSLLERCHHLQIFSVFDDGEAPASVLPRLTRILQTRFSHSLRRLALPLYVTSSHPEYTFVPSNTGLTSLDIGSPNPEEDFPSLSSFENITTLTLYLPNLINHCPPWSFPHLRSLGLTAACKEDIPYLQPFVERHKSTLNHLFVYSAGNSIHNLQMLLTGHIQSLAFDDLNLLNLVSRRGEPVPIAGVSHLGIILLGGDDSPTLIRDAMRRIFQDETFPDLKVLRMLSEIDLVSSATADAWLDAIVMCQDHGMRVEDLHRRLLSVVANSVCHG